MRFSQLFRHWGSGIALSIVACGQATTAPPLPAANASAPTPGTAAVSSSFSPAPPSAPSSSAPSSLAPAASSVSASAKPDPPAAPVPLTSSAFALMNNDFAVRLLSELSKTRGNLLFSPTSVSIALAMTYGGAKGQTAREMEHALSFSLKGERLHAEVGSASQRLRSSPLGGGAELNVANRLWPSRAVELKPSFVELMQQSYAAEPEQLDYVGALEPSRERINAWVSEQTGHVIPELLKRGMLQSNAALVLTNAVYFKGRWATQFEAKNTKQEPFKPESGAPVTTSLMHGLVRGMYADTKDALAIELPYEFSPGGARLVMDVILPKAPGGLSLIEKTLLNGGMQSYLAWMQGRLLDVTLPRFKLSWNRELSPALRSLGMRTAFTNSADFSGMASERLLIALVQHEATIDVNEEGTVAAAATAVMPVPVSLVMPETFRADHPFVFVLRDAKSGLVLFMGRFETPS